MPLPLLVTAALGLAAEYAPALIRHLAGDDAAAVAQTVVDTAQAITGTSSPDEASAALRADPALAMQFRTRMAEIELEREKAQLADRQDARQRDTGIRQTGQHNYRADILAFLAVGGLCFCVWLVASQAGLAERSVNAIMFVAGVLASAVRDVFAFEFGSSRGSKEKDALLAGK